MRLLHPLAGSNLMTYRELLREHRAFEGPALLPQAIGLLAIMARFSFYQFEHLLYRSRIAATVLEKDPIFILGHWRSGTTHLHNLLSRDPQFAWISFLQTVMPLDFLGKLKIAPPIIERILPETRGMDNVSLTLDSPQEEEMALGNMNPLCYYNCYYFPEKLREHYRRSVLLDGLEKGELERFASAYRYLLQKLTLANEGKRLLLKNPASTTRARWLKTVFPNARFIHIVRNPYNVFCSTVKHYGQTMPAFAWQTYEHLDFETITLENYRLLMERYLQELPALPAEDLIEVTYEEIEQNPMREIEKIYDFHGLTGRREAFKRIEAYIHGQRNYRRNVYRLTPRQVERIKDQWGFALDYWNYHIPAEISIL